VLKRPAYPSALLATLILAACGGNGPDIPKSASSSTPAPTVAAATEADTTLVAAADPAPEPVVEAAAVAHLYVAPNGSDSNPGTQAAPFKTIVKASQVAAPGTTVHVAPGNYPGGFETAKSGTAGAPIRYISDTKWGAKIVPSSTTGVRAAWNQKGNYVQVYGFEIDGTNFTGGTKWWTGLIVHGSYNHVEGNHVHHIAQAAADCTSNGGSGINANDYFYGYHVNLYNNVVHDIGVASCHNIHGIYMATSGDVMNNLIYKVGYGGIHLWHDASNNNIANNTVFASTIGIIVGGGDFVHSTTKVVDYVNVSNNITYDNVTGITESGSIGTHNTFTNNLSFKNTYANWLTRNPHSGSITADPQFVNYKREGGGDYRLKSTSPAVGYGSPTYAPPFDLLGYGRPQGGRDDIGAYEYVGAGAK
jgi:parallel beta-helix repeat protein